MGSLFCHHLSPESWDSFSHSLSVLSSPVDSPILFRFFNASSASGAGFVAAPVVLAAAEPGVLCTGVLPRPRASVGRSTNTVLCVSGRGTRAVGFGFGFGFERFLYFSRKGRLASSKLT